jgi:small subunit ribosomal protein S16
LVEDDMSVKIRLKRAGATNRPFFRVVVADGRSPVKGRFIEAVGWYDPKQAGENYELKLDRIEYWKERGAQLSDTVSSLVKRKHLAPERVPEKEPVPEKVEKVEEPVPAEEPAAEAAPEPAAEEPAAEAEEAPEAPAEDAEKKE